MKLRKAARNILVILILLSPAVLGPISLFPCEAKKAIAAATSAASAKQEATLLEEAKPQEGQANVQDLLNIGPEHVRNSTVTLSISVSQNQKYVDTFYAYPYPVRPPVNQTPQMSLPTRPKALRQYLLNSGYSMRLPRDRPYQTFGLRWNTALDNALKRHGGRMPMTIFGLYQWVDEMIPYVIPEVKRINAIEQDRTRRYNKATYEYQRDHTEVESEATRLGLTPQEIRINRKRTGTAQLPEGTWWIAGTHKVPGLTYYWQIPVSLTANDSQSFKLTEDNAIFIEGGW
jgi:hypothetical protein